MAISTAAALLGSAALGTGASIYAGNKAASAQRQGAKQSTDAQLQMFNQARQDQAPWRAAGVQALGQLQGFMGLPVTGGQPGGQQPGVVPSPGTPTPPSMQNTPGQAYPISGPSRDSAFGRDQTAMYGLRNNPLEPMINPVGPQQNALLKMFQRNGIQPRQFGGPVRRGGLYSFAEDGNPEAFVDMTGRASALRGPGIMRAPTDGTIVPNPSNVTPLPQVGSGPTKSDLPGNRGAVNTPYGSVGLPAAPTPVSGAPGGAMQTSQPISAPQPPAPVTPLPQVQTPPTQAPNAPQVDPQSSLDTFLDSINYKFLEDRGQNALTRLMASGGLQGSGRMLEAGMDLNQNMAHSRAIMPYMNQLNLLAGLGQNATMQGGNQAMQMGGVMGQNAINAGNARASSYQNTGNALGNLINQGAQLYGMQQGGYFNPQQPPPVPIGTQWSAGGGFSPYGP